ncbi:MAG: substrate-binding domain-containing protein [Candidatus Flexifilum sp.]
MPRMWACREDTLPLNRASSDPSCIPISGGILRALPRDRLSIGAVRTLLTISRGSLGDLRSRFKRRRRRWPRLRLRWLIRRGVVASALALIGCTPAPLLPAATPTPARVVLRLYVTSSTEPLARDLAAAYRRSAPHVSFDIVTRDHEEAAAAILSAGEPAYLLTHHPPSDEGGLPWAAPIARDAIAVITSGSAAPAALSTAELRAIYQGWIDRWSQVGGADAPIAVIAREDSSALHAEFQAAVLGSRAVTPMAQIAPGSAAMIESVAQIPGAIGYVSAGALAAAASPDVRTLLIDGAAPTREQIASGLYPLRTFIYLLGPEEPQGELRAFIGWAQGREGQAVVNRHYQSIEPMAN